MKKLTIKIQPKQHYQSKMSRDELQEYLKTVRNGVSVTKNKKKYQRKAKHSKKDLIYG